MNIKRIMIAAPKSGSGKTITTCALLQILKNNNIQVASYKCGPDYIDPMFHEKVIGISSRNLDTFFTGEAKTRELFVNSAKDNGFAVLEGVMGLYDGLGSVRKEGSSYHIAKVTKTPIVLVVDTKGMGRSIIPLIAGFLNYDKEQLIKGIILNRVSKRYYKIIKPLIEEELNIKVVGFMPEKNEFHIESRHLGLIMPDEINGIDNIKEKLQTVADLFAETVSVKHIIEIAKNAAELKEPETKISKTAAETFNNSVNTNVDNRPVIAVAKDEAFCFYYIDNILALEESGAKIKYFSPLHDEKLPDRCHALLIGGGYPELYAEKLSKNSKMRTSIQNAAKSGMPIVAECGGFMYLHDTITDSKGHCYDMAGVIHGVCFYTGRLVRFGYIELYEKQSFFLPEGEIIKGHEFHYYDSTNNGTDVIAKKPVTKKEYSCIIADKIHWMGFPHLYYPSHLLFVKAFVEKARQYRG